MIVDIYKDHYVHCSEETNIRDPRRYEHYWISSCSGDQA